MDTTQILKQARPRRGSEVPQNWVVLPLERNKVILAVCGWIFAVVLGLGLFTVLALITIPYNYKHGVGPAIFSSILLVISLFIGLGGIWLLTADIRRLLNLEKHVIIITPDAFVKQEGETVIYVPLMYVRHVIARGAASPAERNAGVDTRTHAADNLVGFFAGRGLTASGMRWRRGRMGTPTSLAFIDARTASEVTVVADGSYGDPFMIAAHLEQYTSSAQNIARHARGRDLSECAWKGN